MSSMPAFGTFDVLHETRHETGIRATTDPSPFFGGGCQDESLEGDLPRTARRLDFAASSKAS